MFDKKFNETKAKIDALCEVPESGKTYPAKVARIEAYGAFVTLPMGTDGLVHVSEIVHKRVEKVKDYLQIGQEINVKLLEIDNRGRLKLSMKALIERPAPEQA